MKDYIKRFRKRFFNPFLPNPTELEAFITTEIKQIQHDHEILVNTILEVKNTELKAERLRLVGEVEKYKSDFIDDIKAIISKQMIGGKE